MNFSKLKVKEVEWDLLSKHRDDEFEIDKINNYLLQIVDKYLFEYLFVLEIVYFIDSWLIMVFMMEEQ